jgi:gamma-glutamyltranspeptidase/glutathione hydrolase
MIRPLGLKAGLAAAAALAGLLAPPPSARAVDAASGARGAVVASQADAARAGLSMLAAGGNAVDAAVATALALAVTQPFSAGLGGGAFVLVRRADGRVEAIDARETAPAAADRDMFVRPGVAEDASLLGGLAVATPGFVRGLAFALERHGSLAWEDVIAPAVRLAEAGFAIGPYHAATLEGMRRRGLPDRFPETAKIQLPPPGERARAGWRLRQPELARTLRTLAEQGPEAFHGGEIARRITRAVKAHGGLVDEGDLASYRPVLRPVVRGSYRGLEILSFPPPSSGGAVLVEMLNVLEGFDLAQGGPGDPAVAHRVVEAMKLAFADRAAWFGDPDFVEVPVAELTSKDYARTLRQRIDPPFWKLPPWRWGEPLRALPVEGPGLPPRDAGTTHLSTTDAAGNAVALTMTINTPFGSGITVPGTGILLNNEMDDFARAPDTPNAYGLVDTRGANAVAARKRPLSSMTPTLVLREGEVFMVTGSPGGPRIVSTTLHTILNVVDHGMDVKSAVAAPRYHHQWVPDVVYAEPALDPGVVAGLRARGHTVEVAERPWSSAQSIVVDPKTGLHHGGSDPRGDGLALGF